MKTDSLVWRLTPRFSHRVIREAYYLVRLLPNAAYDFNRYLKRSGMNRSHAYRGERAARIVLAYHQLEKGLSLAEPRPGFGVEPANRLLGEIATFAAEHGIVDPATTGLAVLREYLQFNRNQGREMAEIRSRYDELRTRFGVGDTELASWRGGALRLTRKEIERARGNGFREMFSSRHSIRHFSGGPIPEADIRDAVALAQKTPSVCNRQAWRVHAFPEKADMSRLLDIQAGSRGFGNQSSVVLIITCDLTHFVDVGERYQAWIDGGMFSMSLCLALHSMGYGSCCLNWSKEKGDDIRLRRAAALPENEQVIMLIVAGTLPEEFSVARSCRLDVSTMLTIHRQN